MSLRPKEKETRRTQSPLQSPPCMNNFYSSGTASNVTSFMNPATSRSGNCVPPQPTPGPLAL